MFDLPHTLPSMRLDPLTCPGTASELGSAVVNIDSLVAVVFPTAELKRHATNCRDMLSLPLLCTELVPSLTLALGSSCPVRARCQGLVFNRLDLWPACNLHLTRNLHACCPLWYVCLHLPRATLENPRHTKHTIQNEIKMLTVRGPGTSCV